MMDDLSDDNRPLTDRPCGLPVLWTLDDALPVVRSLNIALSEVGWCVALGGGVLNKGWSYHDLDLVLVPFDSTKAHRKEVDLVLLSEPGWVRTHRVEEMHANWRSRGLKDRKHVEAWQYGGRRVDFISPATVVE